MEFLLIAVAHFLALLSPGPDFFLVVRSALRLPLPATFAGLAAGTRLQLDVQLDHSALPGALRLPAMLGMRKGQSGYSLSGEPIEC